jgi:hypothetical protein
MKVRPFLLGALLSAGLSAGVYTLAQFPHIGSPINHHNLVDAQRLVAQASQKVNAAQRANEWDTWGHAAKAQQLLDEASDELRRSAEMHDGPH